MGSGSWDSEVYTTSTVDRRSRGVADFGYHEDVMRGRASGIHSSLDPKLMTNGIRESRDSDEHPNSIPIAVVFDVTGSMGGIPRTFQSVLGKVMDMVIAKARIPDPQILIAAVGDSYSDRYPFQVGQFESDNRFEEQLRNVIIEGGGGGTQQESYALSYRFAAYHTSIDSFEKRGKKGYFFTIGDENPWPTVTKQEALKVFGVEDAEDETVESLIAKASEKWEIFHIFPTQASNGRNERIKARWKALLGERVVELDNQDLVCETIAGLVSMLEASRDLETVISDIGLSNEQSRSLREALTPASSLVAPPSLDSAVAPSELDVAETVTHL